MTAATKADDIAKVKEHCKALANWLSADGQYDARDCVLALLADHERLEKERVPVLAFVEAWELCESNRGRYSCTPAHDSRCDYQLAKSGKCMCGSLELEEAYALISTERVEPPA